MAPDAPDTLVVVPCYDEASRLELRRFDGFLRENPDVGLVLVDDGSRDGTLALLKELAAAHPERVEVVGLPRNRGKAEAVRQGVLRALARRPACFGYWDADLSTPLETIRGFRALLRERPELQLVLGARVQLLGHRIERRALRHYVGRVGATAISGVLGLPVYDTQCGAKLFRADAETAGLFDEPFLSPWLVDVELLARWKQARARSGGPDLAGALYEYPLPEWRDVRGSKLRALDYLGAARDLLRIRRRYLTGPALQGT
jgi:dolichyl-phosphate beta-glucosyltransferase